MRDCGAPPRWLPGPGRVGAGPPGTEATAIDLARARNTIPWEVLACMAARLDRVYYPQAGPAPSERVTGAVPDMRRPTA